MVSGVVMVVLAATLTFAPVAMTSIGTTPERIASGVHPALNHQPAVVRDGADLRTGTSADETRFLLCRSSISVPGQCQENLATTRRSQS